MSMTRPDPRDCPACDSATLAEFDPLLLVYVCSVCSTTWRRPRGRLVPPVETHPRLPGTVPPLDFDESEL